MTNSDWATIQDPKTMIRYLCGVNLTSERKYMRIAEAAYHLVWEGLKKEQQEAVVTMDWFLKSEQPIYDRVIGAHDYCTWQLMGNLTRPGMEFIELQIFIKALADDIRDIIGLNIGACKLHSRKPPYIINDQYISANNWESWMTEDVTRMAHAAYTSHTLDNECLAAMSDALEEAGCNVPHILEHLRSGARHVRGCWVMDLILEEK